MSIHLLGSLEQARPAMRDLRRTLVSLFAKEAGGIIGKGRTRFLPGLSLGEGVSLFLAIEKAPSLELLDILKAPAAVGLKRLSVGYSADGQEFFAVVSDKDTGKTKKMLRHPLARAWLGGDLPDSIEASAARAALDGPLLRALMVDPDMGYAVGDICRSFKP